MRRRGDTELGEFRIHAPREGERPDASLYPSDGDTVSIHAPREAERAPKTRADRVSDGVQSTLPARGSITATGCVPSGGDKVPITLPPRGAQRRSVVCGMTFRAMFQSSSLRGGATQPTCQRDYGAEYRSFQSSSPRAEHDGSFSGSATPGISVFNPRSPRGERLLRIHRFTRSECFQSTLPARGSDPAFNSSLGTSRCSHPAPARGEHHFTSDYARRSVSNPRLPARGATT